MNITCTFVEYHDDIAPEFAPEPIVVACTADATVRVWGCDEYGHGYDLVLCDAHRALLRTDVGAADRHPTETAITEAFAHGYGQGVGEARLVSLDARLAAIICHEDVEAACPPRDVLSGTWAGESLPELGLTDEGDAEAYQEGFVLGWTHTLEARASVIEMSSHQG